MISIIRDNKGWRNGFLSWKKGVLLAAAMAILTSVWSFDADRDACAQEKDKNIQLNFKDTPIETIMGYLSETAGVVVISETSLSGRLTVISKKNLSLDEAVSLINTILKEKGYTAIRSGNNLKVTTLAAAKKMSIPVITGNDPNAITPGDDIITCIIPVSYAKAANLKDNIKAFLSDTADYSSNADTNTLVITDSANNIRRVLEIIKAIDTHMAAVAVVRVFHLSYASAEDTATLLTNVFKSSTSSSSSSSAFQQVGGRFAAVIQGGMPGQQGQQGQQQTSQDGQSSTSVSLTAKGDDRTNSVVVSAPQDTMAVVEKVIKDLDSDSSVGQALFVYKLKNGQSSNLVTVLNNLFTSISSTTTSSSSRTSSGATGQQSAPIGPGSQGGSQGTASSSSATGLVGNVYVKADTDTNSLIFLTSPSNYEKIKKMVEDLDKPVPQVLIKALIAEVSEDASRDLGTEFSFLNDWKDKGITDIQVGSAFDVPDTLAALSSGGWATVVGEKFNVKIKALAETGKLNVLSKPYILATNNQEATMTIGSSVPYITDTRTTDTGQTINTIQYEDIGIILTVTPVINDEGLVTMDITQEISSISDATIPISSSVNAAVFNKRTSTSRVIARDGQTVVIGGLMKDSKTRTSTRIPILGSIPILGALFGDNIKKDEKTELLIFITPTVAATDKDLERISNEKKNENPAIEKVYSKKDLGFEDQGETDQEEVSPN